MPRTWSDVSASWMTAALSHRLPGVVVGAAEVCPLSRGTNARARVALVYAEGSGPRSVFVKAPGAPAHRLALAALGALATEARLAGSAAELPLRHPRPYAGAVDWKRLAAVVVTEDVVASGGVPGDPASPLSAGAVRDGLEGLARLHARYWDRPVPAALQFLRPWRLGRGWAAVSVPSIARGLRRLRDAGSVDTFPAKLVPRSLSNQFRRSALLAATGAQTVLHGDPHPGNSYQPAGGGTGFFDWQLARTGSWSHDVGYFLAGSLDVNVRRAHEHELLRGYLHALEEAGAPAPAWDAAWARYRASPAFGLATWVHTLSFGTLQHQDACIAMIGRFAAAYDDLETGRSLVGHT